MIDREYLDDGRLVITHRVLLSCRWFAVKLNRIHCAEGPGYNHDHGAPYISIVLRGGYTETVNEARVVRRGVGSVAARRATDRHYITAVRPGCLTLMIGGPRGNRWQWFSPSGRPLGQCRDAALRARDGEPAEVPDVE